MRIRVNAAGLAEDLLMMKLDLLSLEELADFYDARNEAIDIDEASEEFLAAEPVEPNLIEPVNVPIDINDELE